MIRLTHRRCRHEVEGLADAALRQTERAEDLALENKDLADRLREEEMASHHLAAEIDAACEDAEYAEEAAVPDHLREQLLNAHDRAHVLSEHMGALDMIDRLTDQAQEEKDKAAQNTARFTQALARMLEAAHAAGSLARTYALAEGAGMDGPVPEAIVRALGQTWVTTWHGAPWNCQGAGCDSDIRTLVWHPDVVDRAHMACKCGRTWPAPAGAVDRAESEVRSRRAFGGSYTSRMPWASRPAHVLEAVDRALPTPAECRQAVADAA